jgi:hypothetical protein
LNQLYSRLVELHEAGKKAVVLIDEAQMLQSKELMEEFRGLLNLELPESKLITFVFFGLPEMEDYLHLDEPLAQRVALKCKLESFNQESTEGYINHRMRLAGAKASLFSAESARLIHHYSRGIPRLINTICDNSLFEGYLLKKKTIEADLVQAVVTDLGLITPRAAKKPAGQKAPGEVVQMNEQFTGRAQPPTPPTPPPPALEPDPDDAAVNAALGIEDEVPTTPTAAPKDEVDAMFNGIKDEEKKPPKPKDDLDDMLDTWEKK